MSTAYSSAKQQYIGNGVTTEWGFDFPIKKHSELKVYLKRSEMPQALLEEGVDYSFVTENTIAFPIKTGEAKLQATDVLALQRESVFESEYNFSNQQRLEPEEVMHADDNLERQIQELKRDVSQAIRIQPTSNINTDEYFVAVESIYENLDNITNVSGISSEIVNCSDNISDISTVSSNIANVNAVGPSISSVNTVAGDISSVNTVAGVSTDVTAVAGIASSVPTVANNDANITTVANNISDVNTAATNIEAIKDALNQANSAQNSATQAAQSASEAAQSATASANSANNSHIWAEGTDAQVQALGGVHSSKVWAQQSTNANIALTNSPYTTNRILEIPQDIKLELNNGTLTLKAGSKVYVPNGFEADGTTPKFDTLNIQSDVVFTQTSESGTNFLFYTINNSITRHLNVASGTSIPSGFTGIFYNTSTNHIYYCNNGTGTDESSDSFPVAIITVADNQTANVSSIDQVFNGFGYIGSTVFALPGVKVQIPNGKNEDGTYKSGVITSNSVFTRTATGDSADKWIIFNGSNVYLNSKTNEVFDADSNYWKYNGTKQGNVGCLGSAYFDGTKITSFTPYTVDSVVNSNLSNLSAAGQNVIQNIADKSGNPTGTIIVWSSSTPPAGYLVCNGAAISRTTYAALFHVIGTMWGAGDGNTTFNLPNLYLLSDIKVKGYTKLGLTTYSAPNVPSSNLGMFYRADEPAGASGPFVMFNQNVQNQGIGLTSDVNSTGLAYQKSTFPVKFCIRY